MKTLTINEKKLSTATLPQLLKGFESCVDQIFKSRTVMYKIVSEIDNRNLLSKKSSFTKRQLATLSNKGISRPWERTTKEVMSGLYDHFSWSQYSNFGVLVNAIPMEVAERVSEDALILLNKKRDNIKLLLPSIKKTKGVITREAIQKIVDTKIKTPTKTVATKPTIEIKSPRTKILRLTKALDKAIEMNKNLNNLVKELRKENRRLNRLVR